MSRNVVRQVASAVLLLSFIVFVALFGRLPVFRRTPIGFLHRLLVNHIPAFCSRLDDAVTGGRTRSVLSWAGHFVLYERHPLVLIFYLSLLTSSVFTFLYHVWWTLRTVHHFVIPPLVSLPYIFTYLAATSTGSRITLANLDAHLKVYPFDYALYHPNRMCATCRLLKPARSKHCSTCDACIAKADHHCAWVNNCIGRDNYRWFVGLLGSLSIILVYGATLAYGTLSSQIWMELRRRTTSFSVQSVANALSVVLARNVWVGGIGLLALLTAPLASGLFLYHVYLIWAGMTTNETSKWANLRDDMKDGLAWKAQRSRVMPRTTQPGEPAFPDWPSVSDQIVLVSQTAKPPEFGWWSDERLDARLWEQCVSLQQVDNVYDLGFRDNLLDAVGLLSTTKG